MKLQGHAAQQAQGDFVMVVELYHTVMVDPNNVLSSEVVKFYRTMSGLYHYHMANKQTNKPTNQPPMVIPG